METTLPGMAENPPLAPPVAPVGPGASAAAAAASPAAAVTAPLFGGFRGGRKRKDGLAPGSSEAIEADREKDRLRKERQRSRSVEPPALPAAGAAGVAGQAQAAAGAVGVGNAKVTKVTRAGNQRLRKGSTERLSGYVVDRCAAWLRVTNKGATIGLYGRLRLWASCLLCCHFGFSFSKS